MALPAPNTPKRIPPAPAGRGEPPGVTPSSRNAGSLDLGATTVARDVFALQAELDRLAEQFDVLRRQLRASQKLASLGTTAAMIAHEFNNLFTPVVAYAQQALDTDDVELMRMALRKTLDHTETIQAMTDRTIGMARQGDDAVRPVCVRQVAETAISCLGRDLGKDNIAVNVQIDAELKVRAVENQLAQVLFNLVINARQAMLGRRGRLTIDAAPTHDGRVEINVRDTGCGIAPEHHARIFEPFFSTKQSETKPDRRGLGLGLSISCDIIEDLGGEMHVESELNVGTTFTIVLPQAE